MTRADGFKELLQVLGAARTEDCNLFMLLEGKFKAVEREFQQAVNDNDAQHQQYWKEVVEGKIPKYISMDKGKTFLKLSAIPDNPSPNDKVAYIS